MTQHNVSNRSTVAAALATGLLTVLLHVPCAQALPPASIASEHGDPVHGKVLYQICEACHSIEDNDLGPRHRGVLGREAGSVKDYAYSPALKRSGLTWDRATLDAWLANPSALVPGTRMFFKIDDPQTRADIIAFLSEQR